MLSALGYEMNLMQGATLGFICSLMSRKKRLENGMRSLSYQVNDGNPKALGPTLGYRQSEDR